MELVPCNEESTRVLITNLSSNDRKNNDYVARTFPGLLVDLSWKLAEKFTNSSRTNIDPNGMVNDQLKPFFTFGFLLGTSPQVTSVMYTYFEHSSLQPLPEDSFHLSVDQDKRVNVVYNYPGFSDDLVEKILLTYFKYLSFNTKWFSSIWNWSELGRFIAIHPNNDIRYLAACCLSVITQPNRHQHMSFLRDLIDNYQVLIDLQLKHRQIFVNSFRPVIETKFERADDLVASYGKSSSGYSFSSEWITKVSNILMLKRDISSEPSKSEFNARIEKALTKFVAIPALDDTISRIAYSISINKPCLLRGQSGTGKTAILDYIAAQTCRLDPPDYIKVQIGDQIDSKLLIGSYVCTEIPGQFEWQPGPLTQAMAYGSWIVFEDIDSAPSEMAQVIHSVIENGNLSCVSSCPIKLDSPHPDFRIFFTQRLRKGATSESLDLGFGFVERLCDIVDIQELGDDDLKTIVETRYRFGPLTSTILQLFKTAENSVAKVNINRANRNVTLRDLFKLCDRVSAFNLHSVSDKYSSSDLDRIYLDAVDCFVSFLPKEHIEKPVNELGEVLNKPAEDVERILNHRGVQIREENNAFVVGRARLEVNMVESNTTLRTRTIMAHTKQSLRLIESVSICIKQQEPVLLVGETGVGKTAIIQHLASLMMTELIVINLSQQSDSSDLLGGFKPVEMRDIIKPLHDNFQDLFKETFDSESNQKFLHHAEDCYVTSKKNSNWLTYLKLLCCLCGKALIKPLPKNQLSKWKELQNRARKLSKRLKSEGTASSMALAFSEGSLLRAIRNGKWILLDEINLAEPEVLQCLLLILDSIKESNVYMYTSHGDDGPIEVHPNFRIFACMNPSTDVGKRDLTIGARARFTEFFVNDIDDKQDLRLIVESYVKTCLTPPQIENIVNFYQEVRARASILSDISGNPPVYSLRTLCRALMICSKNVCQMDMNKCLFESLKITFLQQLNEISMIQVLKQIELSVFNKSSIKQIAEIKIQKPQDNHTYVQIEGFWIQVSNAKIFTDDTYIVTPSVRKNLESLARIISLSQRKIPILIQGNTSVGKTSLIKHLAKLTGNTCYRINNHEHTDLQEYVGRYVLKENGELVFQDGLLVTAMKKGYWVILDELNLAPSELLEALNRVLDDNRELFIPETREVVKAHSRFILFATQNPPEEYAGRKLLSRAFRNRFIELHFDEIPSNELEQILHKRCEMAPQYAKKIVTVMRDLQVVRRESGCFTGKDSFMTLRDLFRWGERYAVFKSKFPDKEFLDWDAHIAKEGLVLLEGRVRTTNEADTVKTIIEKVFNRNLDRNAIYKKSFLEASSLPGFKHIHFTQEFQRLFVQLTTALEYKEPVLLCGQTGCGKTTACQLYAALHDQNLIAYNCHLNSESSEFVGDVRPSRQEEEGKSRQVFPWVDGPLVQAMRRGSVFLMDEISLADDAVLERINSVLEPERSITLTEKDGEEVCAKSSFRLVATMNPGGDYGKKELSPALRNRFTEIYCHNTTDMTQLMAIVGKSLSAHLLKPKIAPRIIQVMRQFLTEYYKDRNIVSLRDILSWTKFVNKTTLVAQPQPLTLQEAILNGASLVFLDQFGTCGHKLVNPELGDQFKIKLRSILKSSLKAKFGSELTYADRIPPCLELKDDIVQFKKFYLLKGPKPILEQAIKEFVLEAPTVKKNIMKMVRAMQLDRPILLEGDPGTGKTSIVTALARLTGHELVRINLSEQTDISDLFGSDLPDTSNVEDDIPRFNWHDGPMLKAIKDSKWILLDEMNLASQSVLEGLNACFDHRGEIYIPELNKKFAVDRSSTRIFACQNPHSQGSARKGLPQSFLNRFTSIYIEPHSSQDLSLILKNLYPCLPADIIEKMVQFNIDVSNTYQFSSHEFNLRDLIFWCDLLTQYSRQTSFRDPDVCRPDRFAQFVYLDRMRTPQERNEVIQLYEKVFGHPIYEPPYRDIRLGEYSFIMARSILPRKTRPPPHLADLCLLKYQMPYIESIAKAIESNKMPILVGEPGVGKRSMIRILAGLTGNKLNIIGANREMDTIELLGSFEQKSLQREIVDLVDESKEYVTSLINSISQKPYASTWTKLFKHIWSTLYAASLRDLSLSKSDLMDAYRFQLDRMNELIEKIQPLSVHGTEHKCQHLKEKIAKLTKKFLYHSESMYSSGNFEWIDSVLIRSIREGSWLMIENANLMNPATLDRLNSLVEPNGSLSLNEKGCGPEGIEKLIPHPDFRLILTMDPDFGELSRALRNRGVEIFITTRFTFEDFLMLLNQNGFEPEEKKPCMTYCIMQTSYDTHEKITGEDPASDGSLLAYFGLNYLTTLTHQVRRGVQVEKVLSDLMIAYYHRKGLLEPSSNDEIRLFVSQKMDQYKKIYIVSLNDHRYKWCHLRHDLVSLSGGDAITAMLVKEYQIFFDSFARCGMFNVEERIENCDIVDVSISVKIFLELSSHGDFEYRKGFIKEIFLNHPKVMEIVNRHVDLLHREYIPLLNNLMPRYELAPVTEMHVDTRNSPDLHHFLQALDYDGTVTREDMQNRWLLSLHRITLRMIVELIEDRSLETPGNVSLWMLSERVRTGEMLRDDLIRPQAEIATDLYDLLNGILRVVSNRCFPNEMVGKMMARLFWIGYFTCKLKRAYNKVELIAICNQISMLWALTYQKVIVPIIKDCDLADLTYNNKKFSNRIQHICDFLDVSISKPSSVERAYYTKVLNKHAATSKISESVAREVDKLFSTLIGRYTTRAQALSLGSDNLDTLAASGLVWSNSTYMSVMYRIIDKLIEVDKMEDIADIQELRSNAYNEARKLLTDKRAEYANHETWLHVEQYRAKCLTINRRRNALDQFAPVWQVKFVQLRNSELLPSISNPDFRAYQLHKMIASVDGIIISPRYFNTLLRFFHKLNDRNKVQSKVSSDEDDTIMNQTISISKENSDLYTTFLVDHIIENVVLDNQVVGWTKLRVTTCDLPSRAPLIPEYSPILSLVSSYCLDIAHLKLNSYRGSTQLDSMLLYLWRSYALIKLDTKNDVQDLDLVQNLIHLRLESDNRNELVGSYQCTTRKDDCQCVEEYIRRRTPNYDRQVKTIREKSDKEDILTFEKSIKLIYFGYFNFLEYAPIFTLDPSLRSREKLEIYRSELAHVKLDLYQRNELFYFKTGENFGLTEVSPEDARLYPFSTRVLVERRAKLERSISKLQNEYTNRPKSDDGSHYYELRKEVEVNIQRYSASIQSLINELINYINCDVPETRLSKLNNLNIKCRMLIKNLEKALTHLRSEYVLYADLTTNYLCGMCFVLQGLRRLYSRLEQKIQLQDMSISSDLVVKFSRDTMCLFSFNDFIRGNLEAVYNKLKLYPLLKNICPSEKVHYVRSLLLRSILVQLNHHIIITPSDIKKCIPIVRSVADLFHQAWLERKLHIEKKRKEEEEIYCYKTSRTTLGNEITFERQEFIDICKKFPTYDYLFQEYVGILPMSADKENLETEAKISNLDRSIDLNMCIDICRAHYKFTKEASLNLLGQHDSRTTSVAPTIDLDQLIKLEAEILYIITRHCTSSFDQSFDSLSLECHLLQAYELNKTLNQTQPEKVELGSLKSSIEILDEDIFDIYHSYNVHEALKFQEFISKVDERISALRNHPTKKFDAHPMLLTISKLISRLSSFLLTDPQMKFVTGAQTLLQQIDDWNKQAVGKDFKLLTECDELIELIKSWRRIEIDSWQSSLHRVKRKYIDDTLCDLWFSLYEAFRDAKKKAWTTLQNCFGEDAILMVREDQDALYKGFVVFIQNFIEDATWGDYQIRLDLVFSFAIQTRFSSLYEQANNDTNGLSAEDELSGISIDYEKLTNYVYNIYTQYQGMYEPLKSDLELKEKAFEKELNDEIRIVAWQGRNLWDIKNNFRISHRKLNKVMNKYLTELSNPVPGFKPSKTSQMNLADKLSAIASDSIRLASVFEASKSRINNVEPADSRPINLVSLKQAPTVVSKFKQLFDNVHKSAETRYMDILKSFERTFEDNADSIENFHRHNVQEVVIHARDSKETKAQKHKQCRQMYHSKKYAMQSIFKSLQQLGVSHQRGLNSSESLDSYILSLEPLRGMIQHQSRSVLKSASELIDDLLIGDCNEQYRNMIASIMILLPQSTRDDLTGDQFERIRGYAYDMVLDIIRHNRSAAKIYRYLMDIQAATARLREIQDLFGSNQIIVYNFKRVHGSIQQFNDLVGRSFTAISKLEKLMECFQSATNLDKLADSSADLPTTSKTRITDSGAAVLKEIISEIPEENSLMTKRQFDHIKENLGDCRKKIAEISFELRNKLNCTMRNHLYCDDDIDQLQQLYDDFYTAFGGLMPFQNEGESTNLKEGTVLGSMFSLLVEADKKLKPRLERAYFSGDDNAHFDVEKHPNLEKLNVRLQKLIRQTKLAAQGIHNHELKFISSKPTSESARRKLKPFNHLDSGAISDLLRPGQVARHTGNCFVTLNREESCCNIGTLVAALTPVLFIYTQDVACYLNVILATIHLKLTMANQLIPFFTDLVINGFGLPYKMQELDNEGQKQADGKLTEDNTGFGEGQGETDVSKKLEFESQLDDLKKDQAEDRTGGDANDEQCQPVEAHDDGVEMTDDIDAKAEGADERGEPAEELADDESKLDDYEELDKEFDDVDHDEGHLDENLWGEEDKCLGEDKEEDLRQAELEESLSSSMNGEPELEAKDESVAERKGGGDHEQKQEQAAGRDGDEEEEMTSEQQSKASEVDKPIGETSDEAENDQLDLDDEAAQALKENPSEAATSQAEQECERDEINMSVDDDEGDVQQCQDDDEQPKTPRSEGEISQDNESSSDEDGSQVNMDTHASDDTIRSLPIADDDIDKQLETALQKPLPEERLDNVIEERLSNMSSFGVQERDHDRQMPCRKIGSIRVYDIYQQEEEDPLDFDDEDVSESRQPSSGAEQQKGSANANARQIGENHEQDAERMDTDAADSALDGPEKDEPAEKEEEAAAKSQAAKRTLAERQAGDENQAKRQRIEPAADQQAAGGADNNDDEHNQNNNNNNKEAGERQTVRHIQTDKARTIEVIDLADSDDDLLDVGELVDEQEQRHKMGSKPQPNEANNGEHNKSICSGEDDSDQNDQKPKSQPDGSSYNTNLGLLKYISQLGPSGDQEAGLMELIDAELNRKSAHDHESVDADRLISLWIECTSRTGQLVHELCQQLQMVLQPSKMSKYKGDYKSGKRLNMRKIISYIASHYRKDKIWLRRTKPSKRAYNISLAVDNSSSMSENNCRQMTYQSVALLAKSLSLIEAGALNVVSFGDQVRCIHEFGQPYMDAIGAQWLRELRFNETRTSYKQVLKYSCDSFARQAQLGQHQQQGGSLNQLLVIISDGRNVTSEELEVKQYLRQLKLMGVLTLFIIIDDLKQNDGKSIVDVKSCIKLGPSFQVQNYMDTFPFPFYVLLRHIETMPSILGDALRQWFELVSKS